VTRRDMIKLGIAGGAALASPWSRSVRASIGDDDRALVIAGGNGVPEDMVPSPPTTAFVTPLPVMPILQPFSTPAALTGGPIDTAALPELATFPARRYYELFETESLHRFHPDYPLTTVRGFGGAYPGGTIRAKYGESVLVRVHNNLPLASALRFGSTSTATRLHNGHTGAASDGFPTDTSAPGEFRDYAYSNVYAGFTARNDFVGDPREALGTLWLHDQALGAGVANTYAGLTACYCLFDDLDTGVAGTGLKLPADQFDVPLIFEDKAFNASGALVFADDDAEGALGDKWTVNGAIQPFFSVSPRRYRFRFIAGGAARWWEFHLSDNSVMYQIAEDGNLLNNPVARQGIRMAPGERVDVVIDFAQYAPNTVLDLQNRLQQFEGRGPSGRLLSPGDSVLRFVVNGPAGVDDSLDVSKATRLRDVVPLNVLPLGDAVATRTFTFQRSPTDTWLINGQPFAPTRTDAHVKKETAEIWILQNVSDSASHAVHVHCEECRILSRNGLLPPLNEQIARKDVVKVAPKETVTLFMRFRDWTGPYTMESMAHRDDGAMLRWDLEP
jgi:FtsP/CotA-like multicopper oxidase with cupredoxin domain